MPVIYEWDCEVLSDGETDEFEDNEVIDHMHGESLFSVVDWSIKYPPNAGEKYQIVLVRDDCKGRSWAYLENYKLPTYFTDAYYFEVAKVPKKFHKEAEKLKARLEAQTKKV
jgi:hypothetical protein